MIRMGTTSGLAETEEQQFGPGGGIALNHGFAGKDYLFGACAGPVLLVKRNHAILPT